MSATITNRVESVMGNKRCVRFDCALGAYAANGVSLAPSDIGMTAFDIVLVSNPAGYVFEFVHSTSKVKAYRTAAVAVVDGDVTVKGGAAGTAVGITADSNAGALTKAAAGDRTIPQATFGIAASTANAAAVLAEVSAGVNIASTARFFAIGN